jgi:ATP-dependent DNA helicase RecG
MAISVEQIDLWRQVPSETEILEFKEAKNQFDNRTVYRYCVAIGNEGGGHLVLGIKNSLPRLVVGTSAFNNPAGIAEKLFIALGFRVDVEEIAHPDGRVVVFRIPGRPRGTVFHLEGQYLMRCGESLVPMSEDRLREILNEGKSEWLEGATADGLTSDQVLELLDVVKFFELRGLPLPEHTPAILDRLVQERLVDLSGPFYAIRRIGALLLAKNLGDFPELSRKAARVIIYSGSSKLETARDVTGTKGYAVGFQELVGFIVKRLPENEVIENALRHKQLIPEVAVRELTANALIHQDFSISGTSVMFEIYDNRVEFSSPGLPVFPVERFIDGHQSRNERLADLMRRLRICEEKGSGVDRVIHAAEMYQLPAPEFRKGQNRTVAIIFRPRPFEDMDKNDRIRACYQHCALKYVMCEKMTNQSLRKRFRLPESRSATISQVISATTEQGLVKMDEAGSGKKFARYVPFWA